jgi:hypothetical protein
MMLVGVFITLFRVLALGFELGTYVSSCIRILIGSHSPPLVAFSGPSIGIRAGLVTCWL